MQHDFLHFFQKANIIFFFIVKNKCIQLDQLDDTNEKKEIYNILKNSKKSINYIHEYVTTNILSQYLYTACKILHYSADGFKNYKTCMFHFFFSEKIFMYTLRNDFG